MYLLNIYLFNIAIDLNIPFLYMFSHIKELLKQLNVIFYTFFNVKGILKDMEINVFFSNDNFNIIQEIC